MGEYIRKNFLFCRGIAVLVIVLLLGFIIAPSIIATDPINDDFDEEIEKLMEDACFPSLSACIIKNNSVVWSKGYGLCDIRNNKEATNDTIYLTGSISKTITATAIMQLWEQGLFNLDDDVNEYLPYKLRNPKYPDVPITFRMLLAHQSSLSKVTIGLFLFFSILRFPVEKLPEYILPDGRIYNPLSWVNSPPGEKHTYSSIGYEILGYLVEHFSNQSFTDYCQEHIFQPLKMFDTSFLPEDLDEERFAIPYVHFLTKYLRLPHYTNYNFAAGGVRTTILDLARYLLAYMNWGEYDGARILEEETVDLMLTYQYQYPDNKYGLGWKMFMIDTVNDTRRIGHSGAVLGGLAYMYYLSSNNTGVIYAVNQYLICTPKYFQVWNEILSLLFEKAQKM